MTEPEQDEAVDLVTEELRLEQEGMKTAALREDAVIKAATKEQTGNADLHFDRGRQRRFSLHRLKNCLHTTMTPKRLTNLPLMNDCGEIIMKIFISANPERKAAFGAL